MDKTEVRKRPFTQFTGRMLGNGVDHIDYMRLVERTDKGEDWVSVCKELGDKAFSQAEAQNEKGHTLTARLFYLNAQALRPYPQLGKVGIWGSSTGALQDVTG